MPDIAKSTNPAVLRYRGLDLEAAIAVQMRNVEALRRMTSLMFDATETVTRRQAEFLRSGIGQMATVLDSGEAGASEPQAIFERQIEAYRDAFGALASHAGDLAEITSRCCAGLVHETTEAVMTNGAGSASPEGRGAGGPAASKAGPVKK